MSRRAGADCDPTTFTIHPQTLAFADLAPGRAQSHVVHVENLGLDPITVSARVEDAAGPLFAGPAPLDVSVTTAAGSPAVVASGDRLDLTVSTLLPADAGPGYADLHGAAVVRLVATTRCTDPSDPTEGGGVLALTGFAGPLVPLLLAGVLVLAGALLRRRTEAPR